MASRRQKERQKSQNNMPLASLSETRTARSHTFRGYGNDGYYEAGITTDPEQEGKVEVIANEEGDRQIPSVLSYIEGEEYHGTQAKAQLVRNSKNTVAYFRDFIGKE